MYATRTTQLIVGLFAIVGIAALAFLSLRLGRVDLFQRTGYTLYADFDNIAGLKTNDRIEVAGVPIGHVSSIALNEENYRAHVGLFVKTGVKVDDEAIASIKTSGIIGDKYVAIQPGAGEKMLANDGVIVQTQSAFVLEDAIGQLINNSGPNGGSGSSGANNSAPNNSSAGGSSAASKFPSIMPSQPGPGAGINRGKDK
ncbi:MAG: outer membrane lipid asymmetry maintenance protein MlaD [Candidatus Binataceae bacterium]|nr:outer membrane lipid asymmetry maintenance protein MlaD [Candidatus Binataceae bacterium]